MWPDHAKYSDAIQNPARCFLDPELQACAVATNRLGLPKPSSGQFAVAFELHGPRVSAVKCFTQQVRDQQTRYEAIARHLRGRQVPVLVDFQYLSQGIRVDGSWYPIVKMEWAGGELLSQYVGAHAGEPAVLQHLANEWRNVLDLLRRHDMAHGDLQNGNVKVVEGQVRLIDYDGMYVPALRGKPPREIGVRHFQHPRRTSQDFGPEIDNFSALVIYLSLLAVAADPTLWADYFQDENLILTQTDFESPGQTRIWNRLQSSPDQDVRRLATYLEECCRGAVATVPSLDSALRGQPLRPTPAAVTLGRPGPKRPPAAPWYLQEMSMNMTVPAAESAVSDPWYRQRDLELPMAGLAANAAGPPIGRPREAGRALLRRFGQLVIAVIVMLAVAEWTGIVSVAWPWQELAAGGRWISEVAGGGGGSGQQPIDPTPASRAVVETQPLNFHYYEADAASWEGGWYRGDGEWYGRPWVALYGRDSEYPSAWLFMQIDAVPVGAARLYLDGLDDDWAGTNRIAVEVNGTTIFVGANPFPSWDGQSPGVNAAWGQRSFSVPAGLLQVGRNSIVVTNLEPFANFSTPPYLLLSRTVLEVRGYVP